MATPRGIRLWSVPNIGVIKDAFPRDDAGGGRGSFKNTEGGGFKMRNIVAQIIINEIEDDNITSTVSEEGQDREEKVGDSAKRESVEAETDPENDSKNNTVKGKKVNLIRYKYEGSLQVEADFTIPYNLGDTKYGKYESKGKFLVLSYRSRPH